ncbi:50S ribosomal protein L22 [Candidatus Kuenenbacteria bacterium]|nr:50S ribosomal protein L22 [Candidatus Kuenenbacteria bacterium]
MKEKKIIAKAKYVRISPKKIRLVINVIRGLDVIEAENQLKFISKKSCHPVLKLLNSAIANAKHDFDFKKENLYIKEVTVNQGPTLDRWMPRAFGRAAPIRKRTSHVTIILDQKEKTGKEQVTKKSQKEEKKNKVEILSKAELLNEVKSNEADEKQFTKVKKDKMKFKDKRGFAKKVFNRKSG